MRNIIYSAVIIILILASAFILILYYTQDFEEDFDFEKTITINDLEIQKSEKAGANYLTFAKGELGTLTLKNSGIFDRPYRFPTLIGCLDLKSNVAPENLQIQNYQFSVSFVGDSIYYPGATANINVDEETELKLIGEYNSYNVPVYIFQESIKGVSIFKIPQDEQNPFDDGSYYSYRAYYARDNCGALREKFKPLATIAISS